MREPQEEKHQARRALTPSRPNPKSPTEAAIHPPTALDALPTVRRLAHALAILVLSLVAWAAVIGGATALAAPSGSGEQEALSDDEIHALTCGHLGVDCQASQPRLRLRVRAVRLDSRARTRVRVRVSVVRRGKAVPVGRAAVRVAGRTVRTDRRGRASMVVRLGRGAGYRAVARKAGARTARATVRVR